jgi:hypothetical protein
MGREESSRGVTLQHTAHSTAIPEPHRGGVIGNAIEQTGHLDVTALAQPKNYSQHENGRTSV